MAVTTDPNLPACPVIGALSSCRAPPGGRQRCAYASGPCPASTRRPATTARPGCSTGAGCRRTTSSPRPTARPTRRSPCWGSPDRSRATPRWPRRSSALQRELFVVGADLATNPEERAEAAAGRLARHDRDDRAARVAHRRARRRAAAARGVHRARRDAGERRDRRGPQHDPARRATPSSRSSARAGERNPEVRRYLNRLSDLLFVLARREAGESEPASRD